MRSFIFPARHPRRATPQCWAQAVRARWALPALSSSLILGACSLDGRAPDTRPAGGSSGAAGQTGTAGDAALAGAGGASGGGAGAGAAGEAGNPGGSSSFAGAGGLAGAGGSESLGGSTGSPDAGGTAEPQLPSCASQYLADLGSASATTSASGTGDFTLSCGAGSSDDVGVYWIAPEAGFYSFDTVGTSFDNALGVVAPSCDGTELACNAATATPLVSEVIRELTASEAVVLVVDGKSGSFGNAVVNAHAITCPAIDTRRQVFPIAATTEDGTNAHDGPCGGNGQLEKTFRYEAPSSGLFRFSASSAAMTPALYVERGPRCGGELLGCNAGGLASPATVVRRLEQGELLSLTVEGTDAAGSFELNVEDISESLCPSEPELSPFDEVSAVLVPGEPSVLTGSCAPAHQRVIPVGEFDLPEHAYPVSIDGASCRVTITADGPVAVYVLDGLTCGGAELFCENVESSTDGVLIERTLGNLGGPEASYVIVVEATTPVFGEVTYTLGFLCAVI
jgi:hypothetical protein